MKLMTKRLEKLFPPLYATEGKDPKDIKIIAKFFTPWSNWRWYATEYDPQKRIFFGYVRGLENELGYFSLDELESVKGPFGLTIERDLYFSFNHTLAEAMEKPI
jgi:hypothetical protein